MFPFHSVVQLCHSLHVRLLLSSKRHRNIQMSQSRHGQSVWDRISWFLICFPEMLSPAVHMCVCAYVSEWTSLTGLYHAGAVPDLCTFTRSMGIMVHLILATEQQFFLKLPASQVLVSNSWSPKSTSRFWVFMLRNTEHTAKRTPRLTILKQTDLRLQLGLK